jgi:hypothetical protein
MKLNSWLLNILNIFPLIAQLFWLFSLKMDSVVDLGESIVPFALVGLAMLLNAPRCQ